MQQQLLAMLHLQQAMNEKVHPQWRQQQFPWHRAIWVECAELLEHHGWKWWKKQQPDTQQVVLELVDIWHFGLSALLQRGSTLGAITTDVQQAFVRPPVFNHFAEAVEAFVAEVLTTQQFPAATFVGLLQVAGVGFDDLYRLYMGKNMLNRFRQDNGYQQGSYIKIWQGREDNQHLAEILEQLDTQSPDYQQQVYLALEQRYRQLEG